MRGSRGMLMTARPHLLWTGNKHSITSGLKLSDLIRRIHTPLLNVSGNRRIAAIGNVYIPVTDCICFVRMRNRRPVDLSAVRLIHRLSGCLTGGSVNRTGNRRAAETALISLPYC